MVDTGMTTTPTQKPRIKRDYSQLLDCYVFVCTGIGQVGFGGTMYHAYSDWLARILEAGKIQH